MRLSHMNGESSEHQQHQVLARMWSSRDSLITPGRVRSWKTVWHFLKKLPYDQVIKFLVTYPRKSELMFSERPLHNAYRSFIYEWQNFESNKMVFLLQVKQSMVYPYSEMLLINEKILHGTKNTWRNCVWALVSGTRQSGKLAYCRILMGLKMLVDLNGCWM